MVPFPPLRVRVRPGKIREPDVLFLRKQNFHLRSNRLWNGADLVMEVVSPDPRTDSAIMTKNWPTMLRRGLRNTGLLTPSRN